MTMNVFDNGFTLRYLIHHPVIWFRHLKRSLRNAKLRVTKGWCPSDTWDMNDWMGTVLPEMLRYMAKEHMCYPGNDKYSTPEAWEDWLNSVADVLEYGADQDYDSENEYTELYNQAMRSTGISAADKIEIKDKYIKRMEEIIKAKRASAEDAMTQIGKNFHLLWD